MLYLRLEQYYFHVSVIFTFSVEIFTKLVRDYNLLVSLLIPLYFPCGLRAQVWEIEDHNYVDVVVILMMLQARVVQVLSHIVERRYKVILVCDIRHFDLNLFAIDLDRIPECKILDGCLHDWSLANFFVAYDPQNLFGLLLRGVTLEYKVDYLLNF